MKKFIVFALLILASCNDFLDTWDGYEIKKGDHYSHRSGMPRGIGTFMSGRHMKFDAIFTSSTLYQPYYDDINKLYGFTDANATVHENSVRFGWRHDGKGSIEIFAYWYADGKRGFHKMGETQIETTNQYELWAKDDTYYFRFNNVEFETERHTKSEHGLRKRLWPYFGGNAAAPNEMLILIYEYRGNSAPLCYSCP
jgi:hypothetical protein